MQNRTSQQRVCFQTMTFPETSPKAGLCAHGFRSTFRNSSKPAQDAFCHRNSKTFASLCYSLVANSFLRNGLHQLPRRASRQGTEGVQHIPFKSGSMDAKNLIYAISFYCGCHRDSKINKENNLRKNKNIYIYHTPP